MVDLKHSDCRDEILGKYQKIFSIHCKQIFPFDIVSKIDCYNYYFCLIEGNKKVKLEIRTCNDGKVFDEETADCQDKIYVKVPCGTSAI